MEKLKDLLNSIQGSEIGHDEQSILEEYNKQGENKSTLAIKVLSIFGGFLATLAFLGFLSITGLYDSEIGLVIVGLVFIVSAIWLNKKFDKLIIDTFSISIYASGFALFSYGTLEMGINDNLSMILIGLIALCSLYITQNSILAFISVLIISGCLLALIMINEFYDLIHLYITVSTLLLSYFFLNEAKIISLNNKLSKLYDPIKIGLVFSLIFGLITIGKRNLIPISQNYIWVSSIVMILVILYLVHTIIKVTEVESIKSKVLIYTLSSLILLSTFLSPSISGAIVIILLSFLINHKTSLAIGIISIIYFVSQYYYDLSFTLLTKSILLFSTGIVFLLLYLFTTNMLNANEKI